MANLDGIFGPDIPQRGSLTHIWGTSRVNGISEAPVANPIASFVAQVWASRGPSFETEADLNVELDYPAGTTGFVYGDTPGLNGVYVKSGASGTGSWTRIGDLPEADLTEIRAEITALWAAVIAGGRPLVAWQTATAYPLYQVVFTSDYRLYQNTIAHTSGVFATDLAAARWVEIFDFALVIEDAEAARDAAIAARDLAQDYADTAIGANDFVDFISKAVVEGLTIPVGKKFLTIASLVTVGLGGDGIFYRVAAEPAGDDDNKIRSTDRFMPDGSTDAGNGGWWKRAPGREVTTIEFLAILLDLEIAYDAADHTAAFQAAAVLAAGRCLHIPVGIYYLTPPAEIVWTNTKVYGDGPGATIIIMKAILTTDHADQSVSAFKFAGANGGGEDFEVQGQKDTYSLSSYSGAGRPAIRISTTEQFYGRNIVVRNYLGTGVHTDPNDVDAIVTLEHVHVYNCGRPISSPGTEHGDGFYCKKARRIVYRNCHYAGLLGAADARLTRGGFVSTDPGETEVTIEDCSSENADRSIHLEAVSRRTVITRFTGKNSRNGLLIFDTDFDGHFVSISHSLFDSCGAASNGVLHTGAVPGLEFFVNDVLCENSHASSSVYLHGQDDAPKLLHFVGLRDDGTVNTQGISIGDGEVAEAIFETCALTGAASNLRRISRLRVSGGAIKQVTGNNGSNLTPRRQYRFDGGVVIGVGLTDGIPFTGDKFADIQMDGVVFDHNSTTGGHAILSVTQANVVINNPVVRIAGIVPTVAWVAGASTNITLNLNNPTSIALASIANIMTKSGTVKAFGYILVGTATHDTPSLAAGAFGASVNVTVTGAAIGDRVKSVRHSAGGAIFWDGVVSAANVATCFPFNPTAGVIDQISGTVTADVEKAFA